MAETEQNRWLVWAQRLQALGATGLHFGDAEFDRERYQEIHGIATQMLADLAQWPVERVAEVLAADAKGYATPQIDVRTALIEDEHILLVQEKVDGRWALPGGFADVGYSAAENAAKEFREEAGLEVRVTRLYCVRHKTKHPYPPDLRDFYKMFFLCERADDKQPAAGLETADVRFFHRDELPELSQGRVIEKDIALAFAGKLDPLRAIEFD